MIWSWQVVQCVLKVFRLSLPSERAKWRASKRWERKIQNAVAMLLPFSFLSIPSHSKTPFQCQMYPVHALFQVSTYALYVVSISRIPRKLSFHWPYSIVHFPNLSQSAIQRKQNFLPLHIFIMTSMSSLSKTLHSPITTREHDDWDVEDVIVYWCWACHFFGFLANSSICDTSIDVFGVGVKLHYFSIPNWWEKGELYIKGLKGRFRL